MTDVVVLVDEWIECKWRLIVMAEKHRYLKGAWDWIEWPTSPERALNDRLG